MLRAPLCLSLHLSLGLVLVAAVGSAPAAQVAPQPAPDSVLAAFDQGQGWIQNLDLPAIATGKVEVELFLNGALRTAVLAPHSLRGPEYQLLAQAEDGTINPVEPGPPTTVRGIVLGYPESFIAASLVNGQLSGIIHLEAGDRLWGVQPVQEVDPAAPAQQHLIYDSAQAPVLPYTCGTPTEQIRLDQPATPSPDGAGSTWIEISCDADTQFYALSGSSVTQTQNDIENVINGVDAIYDADFDIRYLIGTILVRTSEPDPYTTSSPGPALSEFRSEWVSHQGDIKRDVAHLFTGKNMAGSVIGIAYLNGICSIGSGYGVSQSKFTSGMTSRIALTAHELGHNWSANHCNGTPSCWIMCSGLGGCSGGLTAFGPEASAQIDFKKGTISCGSGPPPTTVPVLTSATPSSAPAYQPGLITVSGSGFEWAEEVSLDGVILDSPGGYLTFSDSEIWLTIDAPTSLGANPLIVKNEIGSSSPFNIDFTETFPPLLTNFFWVFSGEDYEWSIGGEADDLWFLAISVEDPTALPLLGYDVLINGLIVDAGALSSVGVASPAFEILPTGIGLTFYSQAALVDGGTGQFHAATNITTAFVLL